ncbi:hypothetical protein M0811_08619 [Anaeramoeba ignava]|uniref:Uncharacterized protein n=1 Tax=Anaeramoeba ignava TaxID=1746090 RepID=A0A9Q0LIG7_ANAIG|nr:hypothetical protein M0811_08619 [Anaeramoeba ignava]
MGNQFSLVIHKKNWKQHISSMQDFKDPTIILNQKLQIEFANVHFVEFIGSSFSQVIDQHISVFSFDFQPFFKLNTPNALLKIINDSTQFQSGTYTINWIFRHSTLKTKKPTSVSITFIRLENKNLAELIIKPDQNTILENETNQSTEKAKSTQVSRLIEKEGVVSTSQMEKQISQIFQESQTFVKGKNLEEKTQKVSESFSELEKFIQNCIEQKNQTIQKLSENLLKQRKQNSKQIQKLESLLEFRMDGMEAVKSQKRELLRENQILKKKLKQIKPLYDKQKNFIFHLNDLMEVDKFLQDDSTKKSVDNSFGEISEFSEDEFEVSDKN